MDYAKTKTRWSPWAARSIFILTMGCALWILGVPHGIIFLATKDTADSSYNGKMYHFEAPAPSDMPLDKWIALKTAALTEADALIKKVTADEVVGPQEYFQALDTLMNIEDRYNIALISIGAMYSYADKMHWYHPGAKTFDAEFTAHEAEIMKVQRRIELRQGMHVDHKPPPTSTEIFMWFVGVCIFLLKKYLALCVCVLACYYMRFRKKGWSIWHELIHHPIRLLEKTLLWPKWILIYPYTTSALQAYLRKRLEAEFWRNRSDEFPVTECDALWLTKQGDNLQYTEFEDRLKAVQERAFAQFKQRLQGTVTNTESELQSLFLKQRRSLVYGFGCVLLYALIPTQGLAAIDATCCFERIAYTAPLPTSHAPPGTSETHIDASHANAHDLSWQSPDGIVEENRLYAPDLRYETLIAPAAPSPPQPPLDEIAHVPLC